MYEMDCLSCGKPGHPVSMALREGLCEVCDSKPELQQWAEAERMRWYATYDTAELGDLLSE